MIRLFKFDFKEEYGTKYIGFQIPLMYKKRQYSVGIIETLICEKEKYNAFLDDSNSFLKLQNLHEIESNPIIKTQLSKQIHNLYYGKILPTNDEFAWGNDKFAWNFKFISRTNQIELSCMENYTKYSREDLRKKYRSDPQFGIGSYLDCYRILKRKYFRNMIKKELFYRILTL